MTGHLVTQIMWFGDMFPSCQCTIESLEEVTRAGHQNTADCWQEGQSCSRRSQQVLSTPSLKFFITRVSKSREPIRRGD